MVGNKTIFLVSNPVFKIEIRNFRGGRLNTLPYVNCDTNKYRIQPELHTNNLVTKTKITHHTFFHLFNKDHTPIRFSLLPTLK